MLKPTVKPGRLRAKSGGISDPRNSTMLKMFNLIDIGERAGSGIPNIFFVWKTQGLPDPVITEQFTPERISVFLPLKKIGDKKSAIKIGDKKSAIAEDRMKQIVDYLTEHRSAKASEIADHIGLQPSRTRDYLTELVYAGIVITEGKNRNRVYRLNR